MTPYGNKENEDVDTMLKAAGCPDGWEPFAPLGAGKVVFELRDENSKFCDKWAVFVRPKESIDGGPRPAEILTAPRALAERLTNVPLRSQ